MANVYAGTLDNVSVLHGLVRADVNSSLVSGETTGTVSINMSKYPGSVVVPLHKRSTSDYTVVCNGTNGLTNSTLMIITTGTELTTPLTKNQLSITPSDVLTIEPDDPIVSDNRYIFPITTKQVSSFTIQSTHAQMTHSAVTSHTNGITAATYIVSTTVNASAHTGVLTFQFSDAPTRFDLANLSIEDASGSTTGFLIAGALVWNSTDPKRASINFTYTANGTLQVKVLGNRYIDTTLHYVGISDTLRSISGMVHDMQAGTLTVSFSDSVNTGMLRGAFAFSTTTGMVIGAITSASAQTYVFNVQTAPSSDGILYLTVTDSTVQSTQADVNVYKLRTFSSLAKVSGSPVGRTTQFKITLSATPISNPIVTVTPSPIQAVVSNIEFVSVSGNVLTYQCSVGYNLAGGNDVTLTIGISGAIYTSSTKTLTYTQGTSVSTIAVFAGGNLDSSTPNNAVDYRFGDATGMAGNVLPQARWRLGGAGSRATANAYFAGGVSGSGDSVSGAVDYYNANGSSGQGTALATPRSYVSAAAASAAGIFHGGILGNGSPASGQMTGYVDYRSGSGAGSVSTSLATTGCASCSMDFGANYALFYGGRLNATIFSDEVDYRGSNGVKVNGAVLIGTASYDGFGCYVDNSAIIMGGNNGASVNQIISVASSGAASMITGFTNLRQATRNGAAAPAEGTINNGGGSLSHVYPGIFWAGDGLSVIMTTTAMMSITDPLIFPYCTHGAATKAASIAVFTGGVTKGNGGAYGDNYVVGITHNVNHLGAASIGLVLPTARNSLAAASAKLQDYK